MEAEIPPLMYLDGKDHTDNAANQFFRIQLLAVTTGPSPSPTITLR